jgi:predicted nucleic acid-binding protein
MNGRKGLVLDANILIRAVFGRRVRQILEAYEEVAGFYSPDVCFQDARKYIPNLSARRGFDPAIGLLVLEKVGRMVEPVDRSLYEGFQDLARERVINRDPDDWPIVAVALLLDLPIWTEDQDFFGSGIATWTTDTVELYLRGS